MTVSYTNNTITIKSEIKSSINSFLHEACGEIASGAKSNSRVKTGQTKGSYEYKVVPGSNEVTGYVGSNFKNAIYEEFGTGEFAKQGGRSGYWVFVKGSENGTGKTKSYTLAEAKKAVAIMRKKGLDAYYTKGKKPNEPLKKSFDSSKTAIQNRLAQILGSL